MTLRERFERLARMALLVFLLAAAAFLSAITAIRLAIHGRETEMPKLVGMKAGEAQTALAAKGLGLKIADRVYSNFPVDYVVRQSPPGGVKVKVGQRAHVVLSLGPQRITIPSLEGKSLRAARIELLRGGVQVGEISGLALPEFEPEFVVRQSPRPGSSDAGSPRVNLLVAQPEREAAYVMPDLAGFSLGEAQRRLGAAGLRLGRITLVAGEGPRATVVRHTPARGARVAVGAVVDLVVGE